MAITFNGLELKEPVWVDKYVPLSALGDVIYVDDNRFNLAWLISLAKRKKLAVRVLCTGFPFDVQSIIGKKEYRPLVIIADVILPVVRATKWLKAYKDLLYDNDILVAFTSSLPEKEFWQTAAIDGWEPEELCTYLEKPWDTNKVVNLIKECLAKAKGGISGEEDFTRRGQFGDVLYAG